MNSKNKKILSIIGFILCLLPFVVIPLRIVNLKIVLFGEFIGCLLMLPDSIEFTKRQSETDYFEYWLGKFFYLLVGLIVSSVGLILMIVRGD